MPYTSSGKIALAISYVLVLGMLIGFMMSESNPEKRQACHMKCDENK